MKKFILVLLVTLATVCFASHSYSQGTLAPLYLFTSGIGSITPLQDGQLLTVGQAYNMTAIPDSAFTFSSWQPVNVFVFNDVVMDVSGDLSTNTSTVASPTADFTETSALTFTMQPVQVILDLPRVRTITESSGWQANFVPVPEPSSITLIVCALAAGVLFRAKRFDRTTMLSNTY